MAISVVAIHIFGDVPSSPLVGILQVCNVYPTLSCLCKLLMKFQVYFPPDLLCTFYRSFYILECNFSGFVQDNINDWRKTSLILTSILFPAAAIWFGGKSLVCIPHPRIFRKSTLQSSNLFIRVVHSKTSNSIKHHSYLIVELVFLALF